MQWAVAVDIPTESLVLRSILSVVFCYCFIGEPNPKDHMDRDEAVDAKGSDYLTKHSDIIISNMAYWYKGSQSENQMTLPNNFYNYTCIINLR